MAQLGFRTFDEMIGRADLLDMRAGIEHWKARGPRLLADLPPAADAGRTSRARRKRSSRTTASRARSTIELIARRAAGASTTKQPVRARRIASATPTARSGAMLSGVVAHKLRPRGLARRHDPRRVQGHRGPELRRVPRARHHVRAAGRDQRLRRQGPVGRAHRRVSRPDVPGQAGGEHRHRQHGDVRRDRGRGVLPRRRGRALLRAQLRRHARSSRAWAITAAST